MGKWSVLIVLSAAQFLMVLDQSVMNVSISQLVADFDTSVTTIQGVITLYSLVMAALMITGGKLGDLWGRRRVFAIGLAIYGVGSALTAASWSVPTLTLGWSVLEGIGAAMVLPALVALTAANYSGQARATAYGVLGGVAGAGIAVGPILGGWADHERLLASGLRRRGGAGDRDPARGPAAARAGVATTGRRDSTGSARCSRRSGSG